MNDKHQANSKLQILSLTVLLIVGGILAGVGLSVLPNLPPEVQNPTTYLHKIFFTKVSSKIENFLFDHKGDIFLIPVAFLLIFLSLIILISFLGCFGSCLGSRCLIGLVWNLNNWLKDRILMFKIFPSISRSSWRCCSPVLASQCQSWCLMLRLLEVRGLTTRAPELYFYPSVGNILNGTIPLYNESADIQALWDTIQHRSVLF